MTDSNGLKWSKGIGLRWVEIQKTVQADRAIERELQELLRLWTWGVAFST